MTEKPMLFLERDTKNNVHTLYKFIDGDIEFIDKSEDRDKMWEKIIEIEHESLLLIRKVHEEEIAENPFNQILERCEK